MRREYPNWINPDFERRHHLTDRWKEVYWEEPEPKHPYRRQAYCQLSSPLWPAYFESEDPGATRFPCEVRHPLMDIRLLRFLLAIPPVPYCQNKWLLREATRGLLPEAVRYRPKTVLAGSPTHDFRYSPRRLWAEILQKAPEVGKYVTLEKFQRMLATGEVESKGRYYRNDEILRPLNFGHWLFRRAVSQTAGGIS